MKKKQNCTSVRFRANWEENTFPCDEYKKKENKAIDKNELEKLFHSKDWHKRKIAAEQGYELDKLVNDENKDVRRIAVYKIMKNETSDNCISPSLLNSLIDNCTGTIGEIDCTDDLDKRAAVDCEIGDFDYFITTEITDKAINNDYVTLSDAIRVLTCCSKVDNTDISVFSENMSIDEIKKYAHRHVQQIYVYDCECEIITE